MEPLYLDAQGSHHQYEGASNGVGSKGDFKPKNDFGGFGGLAHKMMRRFKPKKLSSQLGLLVFKSLIR